MLAFAGKPTNIRPGIRPGLRRGVQTQTDVKGHAGDLLPHSVTVFVEDVDLLRFKVQLGLNTNNYTRPEGKKQVIRGVLWSLGLLSLWGFSYLGYHGFRVTTTTITIQLNS